MTDYSELVKRLRASDAHPLSIHGQTMTEAADALEAQAKAIAKLEAENITLIELQAPHYATTEVVPQNQLEFILYDVITERNILKARIAELETLLKDCADDLEAEVEARYGQSKSHQLLRYACDMVPVVAARAALKEETE